MASTIQNCSQKISFLEEESSIAKMIPFAFSIKRIIDHDEESSILELQSSTCTSPFAAKLLKFPKDLPPILLSNSTEAKILKKLQKIVGFPNLIHHSQIPSHELILMDLLGSNLKQICDFSGGRLGLKSVLMIGAQAIQRLEKLHSIGYLHRDLKPENFVMGVGEKGENVLHLIDFGLASSYLDEFKRHIKFNEDANIHGTIYYLSVFSHLKIEPSRRDDLISLGYMLVKLFKGSLPWDKVIQEKGTSISEKIKLIYQTKATLDYKKLCEGLPADFEEYFEYVTKLLFQEKPDYNRLFELFQQMMKENGIEDDGVFEWNEKKGIDLRGRKILGPPISFYEKKILD